MNNLLQNEYIVPVCLVLVVIFLCMEAQKRKQETFLSIVQPTFYRSLNQLPSVDDQIWMGYAKPKTSLVANIQNQGNDWSSRSCLFEGEKCNCCSGLSCQNGSCAPQ